MHSKTLIRLSGALILPLFLAACPSGSNKPDVDDKTIAAVQQLEQSNQFLQAAEQYLAIAAKEDVPFRQEFRLSAADNLFKGGDLQRAAQVISETDMKGTDDIVKARQQLLSARIALANNDASGALSVLATEYAKATIDQTINRKILRVNALETLGNNSRALGERVELSNMLYDPGQYSENREIIWQRVSALPRQTLDTLESTAGNRELQGWAALAVIVKKTRFDSVLFQQLTTDWSLRYPQHSAGGDFLDILLSLQAQPLVQPDNIALLLPLSGRLARPSAAIRDGFLTAHYGTQPESGKRPVVRIYDSSQQDAIALYQQALAEGANMIVGPLSKKAVTHLSQLDDLDVPVLALNRVDNAEQLSNAFFQFGLPPEEEAESLALRAWDDGLSEAIVVVPDSAWGNRVAQSFRSKLDELGGQVLEVISLPRGAVDFRKPLEQGLNLVNSNQRKRTVNQVIGKSAKFEPRRRQDVDVILVAVPPNQMRSLRPQLQFHHAENIPIYGISKIYRGYADPEADRDLNGVIFSDSPWRLNDDTNAPLERLAVDQYWPARNERQGSLFALGVDAYNLLPYLTRLRDAPEKTLPGASGNLTMDSEGRVHRDMVFGIYRSGAPTRLPDVSTAADE